MINHETKFAMLSTFERSWICMLEMDEDGYLEKKMKIAGPFYTSSRSQAAKPNNQMSYPFLKIAFMVFEYAHESSERKNGGLKHKAIVLNEAESSGEEVETPTRQTNQISPRHGKKRPRSSTHKQTRDSPSSISPSSKKSQTLNMPDFSRVKHIRVETGDDAFLGHGRSGSVFKGIVDDIDVAIKVMPYPLFPLFCNKFLL